MKYIIYATRNGEIVGYLQAVNIEQGIYLVNVNIKNSLKLNSLGEAKKVTFELNHMKRKPVDINFVYVEYNVEETKSGGNSMINRHNNVKGRRFVITVYQWGNKWYLRSMSPSKCTFSVTVKEEEARHFTSEAQVQTAIDNLVCWVPRGEYSFGYVVANK